MLARKNTTRAPAKAKVPPARLTLAEAMSALEKAGSAQTRKTYARHGVTLPMFGVSFAFLKTPAGFFGHSHVPTAFCRLFQKVVLCQLHELKVEDDTSFLVNPGSVGQPRDGDPRAAFAVYDTATGIIAGRRVAYDVERAQAKIRDAGLPPIIWERLSQGI